MSLAKTPPSGDFDALAAYRAMFATPDDGAVAYWYFGGVFAQVAGFPVIPVIQAETVMIYKTTTLSRDAFRMDWWEIGYMRDISTGEISTHWTNPITGERRPTPQKFEEGPAHFVITRDGDGISLELTQAHARIDSVDVVFSEDAGRVLLTQTERKVRGFPLPDGTMVGPDQPGAARALTTLSIIASRADVEAPKAGFGAASSGAYDFELGSLPAWMGMGERKGTTLTRGVMVKAAIEDRFNPLAWKRLQAVFPECFEGQRLLPKWALEPA